MWIVVQSGREAIADKMIEAIGVSWGVSGGSVVAALENTTAILGKYKTRERAKEVFEELLQTKDFYKMPEE